MLVIHIPATISYHQELEILNQVKAVAAYQQERPSLSV